MGPTQEGQEPSLTQIDPKSIHSALREFFQPLRSNDPRADFFSVYRKESEEFDLDYTKKYDEDLNTSLIFAGLFSAVSAAFVIDVQTNLEPDPSQSTAVYMQVLLHTLNASLYPDIAPPPTTWSGPDSRIVLVQCLLYASLAISLFAAFVAMLGKQWLDRFVRKRGRAATEKSWDRQRKFRGMEQWQFHMVMESLPILLQFALLLFGCSVSLYLWPINLFVAGVTLAFTAFGITFYCFVTLAGSLFHKCPYQTPLSPPVRAVAVRLWPRVRRVITPIVNGSRRPLKYLEHLFRTAKFTIRYLDSSRLKFPGALKAVIENEIPEMSLVRVDVGEPSPLFDPELVKWDQHRDDSECVLWVMEASMDADVLLFTFRFAAEIVWYPEIAKSLCPHRVAGCFFDCFLDGNIIPGMEERACYTASTLASALNIRACMKHDLESIRVIGERVLTLNHEIHPDIWVAWWSLQITCNDRIMGCPPLGKDASSTFCIWLSRMVLQSVYWRQAKGGECEMFYFESAFSQLVKYRKASNAVVLNFLLACAVSLGLRISLVDLQVSDNSNVSLHIALTKLNERMVAGIPDLSVTEGQIRAIMRLIRMWNNSEFQDFARCCISWAEVAMDCGRELWHRYLIAGDALCAIDNHPSFSEAVGFISSRDDAYASTALRYLCLYQDAQDLGKFDPSPARPAAAIVALQIIRVECSDVERPMPKKRILGTQLVRVLTWAAKDTPDNPVHFRPLALEIFTLIGGMWFDPWVDDVSPEEKARLINVLGNVLDAPNLTFGNSGPPTPWPPGSCITNHQQMFEGRTGSLIRRSSNIHLIPLLFGLCSSKSWQAHLKKSTFDFIFHKTFKPDHWAMWLRHTWKVMARDSRLNIKLVAIKLKELECYDALALVIRSIWLSPDPDMLAVHHWGWVERETLGLFKIQRGPSWRPLGGYLPILLRTYAEPASGSSLDLPGVAARYIFQYDGADGPVWERREVVVGHLGIWYHHFWVEQPDDWRIRQVCMMKRLYQVLAREVELEGLHVFRRGRGNEIQDLGTPSTHNRPTENPVYFVCDYPC